LHRISPWIRQFVRDFTAFNVIHYSPQSLLDF
jgi:hypothetical protein